MTNTEGLTEDAYTTAVSTAIDTVREKYPELDVRAGTALRALVVEPGAYLDAAQRDIVNRLRTAMSIRAMERETTVPREDADAVLSNFGITLGDGTKATGLARVNLTSSSQLTIRAGIIFKTEDGVEFVTTATTVASSDPADGEAQIFPSSDGRYYFTVPVEAVEVGTSGNIVQGHALSMSVLLSSYYSAEAFSDFSGGTDGESVSSAVARIPASLAYRGMTNSISVRARMADALGDASLLKAVSCVGRGSRAQLRDKHNLFGIAVGGRVDVYTRMFDAPGVSTFTAEGTLETLSSGDKVYRVSIPDHSGFYAVRYVGLADDARRQGSLQYTLVRGHTASATTAHDFDVSSDSCETAWSVYQTGDILVYPAGSASYAERQSFKVDIYWTDGIQRMQELVDSEDVRNVAADYVVRTPVLCLVSITAPVRLKDGSGVTTTELEDAISEYVNSRSFVGRLTRSEIANILLQHGVKSVDLSTGGMQLNGRICGADGEWYYLSGDELDVSDVGESRAMIAPETVVFAAEPGAIQVNTAV